VAAELFVDTSGWFPLAVRGAPGHERLARILRERIAAGVRIVTTNLIVAETQILLLRRVSRAAALRFVRQVGAPPTAVVHSTAELEAAALRDWLEPFEDQEFSLADAVSFVVMRERGIREVLALDRHFAAAGFTVLR
jgi:predicted nucleic acid-binding protein